LAEPDRLISLDQIATGQIASRRIATDQVASHRIATELTELGRDGASGAIEITGRPGGIVYVREGRVVWAESPAVPDLGTRLIRSRRVPPGVWDQITRDDRPHGTVGATLIGRALLTRAELGRLLQSIVLDALLALTAPFAGECEVADVWFTPQRSHWAETVMAMDVAMVRRCLDHMTQRLTWYGITPRWCPQWRPGRTTETLVNSGLWTVAGLIDGRSTVSELAWRGGLALHETMASVGHLVQAGMCTLPAPDAVPGGSAPSGDPAPAGGSVLAGDRAPAGHAAVPGHPVQAPLPRRGPLADASATSGTRATPLEFGLLQRVRRGLDRMA
jgi:hypothetical protein